MRKTLLFLMLLLFLSFYISGDSQKVLFLYDLYDEEAKYYIDSIRSNLKNNDYDFEEVSIESQDVPDLSSFGKVLLYGKVMAFTFKSPLRDWLKTKPSLDGPEIHLFITANRWFLNKFSRQISELTVENGGIIIDTVSSATKDFTDQEKNRLVATVFDKF